ncbi:hypothetical protein K502DRAFT_344689 [Neoconidiobolus thromboides FSU 785]|nr:hypothetical protein K502DRAFT_344689 [Neoconidiobolus thromboides FSU 785]
MLSTIEAYPNLPDNNLKFSSSEMLPENPWQSRPTSAIEASLSSTDLPPIYEKAFRQASPQRGKVPLKALQGIVALSGLPTSINEKIINMCVNPGDLAVSRNTFKLVLTLVALAQKNMDLSFENVQAYLHGNFVDLHHLSYSKLYFLDLPTPSLPGLENYNMLTNPFGKKVPSLPKNDPTSSRNSMKAMNDPWHQPLEDMTQNGSIPFNEENFQEQGSSLMNSTSGMKSIPPSLTYAAVHDSPIDTITIHLHDQLEGFIFKHVNYVVSSTRFNTRVLRRYSEFYILYNYLITKYTYRLIPDLPPKRIGANDSFLEKRRKGLIRFMNFCCNHPVISNDDLLKSFLTNTENSGKFSYEISGRIESEIEKNVQVHINDNLSGDYLVEDVPDNLEVFLDQIQAKLKTILSHYTMMINVTDKIAKQISADCKDLADLNKSNTLPNNSTGNNSDTSDIYSPEEELPFMMLYLQKLSVIMGANSDSITNNVVEVTKGLRDVVSGFIKLLTRNQQRGIVDEERIKRRIKNNKISLNYLSKEPAADKTELDKLAATLKEDQLKLQSNAVVERLVRRTIWNEYQLYRDYQVRITAQMIQNLVNDQIKTCNLSVHNWKSLIDQLSHLS